jgi:hypothetical protein
MGLRGMFGIGVGAERAYRKGDNRFTAWDGCGEKFASLLKGLPPQIRAFSILF